jgi:hypothetical protein
MKSELEETIDSLQEYVIRLQVEVTAVTAQVLKPCIETGIAKEASGKECQEMQHAHNTNSYLFHVTRDKDKLFWAFYIMLNGEDAYKYLKTKFVTEKEIKIGAVEKMRKLPNVFKQHKLNKVRIENELSGDVPLTLEGFYGLCIIYNISAIFMKRNCYCELYGIGDSSVTHIIEEVEGGLGVHVFKRKEASLDYAKRVRESKWKMETILTPIKSISSYAHAELLEIYNKITCIVDGIAHFTEKKKTKQFLYDGICEFLN